MTSTSQTQFGKLAMAAGRKLPLGVYRSAAGYYIGTYSEDGPCSRESVEYFRSLKQAQDALACGKWTQKPHP